MRAARAKWKATHVSKIKGKKKNTYAVYYSNYYCDKIYNATVDY